MKEVKIKKVDYYQDFNNKMFHVRGFWIFTIAFICLDFLFLGCKCSGKLFNPVKEGTFCWHITLCALYIPAWLGSIILEIYAFIGLELYYGRNQYELLQGLEAFHSCSTTAFDLALKIQRESPFIPERPTGQYYCLVLSFIELFLQIFYLNIQRMAYED